ncbi:carbohydrate esterase family 8 protein [Mycena olivaceomarginata]|nr:carbohydrate esterase family 8 protein [Mycena olivaceomarginata]
MLPKTLAALFLFCTGAYATARTAPPSGAVVVRGSGAQAGEFSTFTAAINSLPADTSARTIFVYPAGTYTEQVRITRAGNLTIFGYTNDVMDHAVNQVRLTFGLSQGTAGAGELSATLRIDKAFFKLYNVDFNNRSAAGAQALAVAGYGSNLGFYAVGFYGYQDTLRAEKGVQFYGLCYIEGAVDFIFGQSGHAFFHRNTIASVDSGAITADGPDTADLSLYVINLSTLTTSTAATANLTGKVFLGRPWSAAAQVVYISTNMGAHINPAGWEPWSTAEPNTSGVLFAEFGSTGPGAAGTRASFSKKLTSAAGFGIADVLGANWATWVDAAYFT